MKTEHIGVPEIMNGQLNLEELVRLGAQKMLAMALEAEITTVIEQCQHIRTAEGKAAMVRNGYLPERMITTSAGPVSVRVPRSRSSLPSLKPFTSALVPRYMRKTLKIEEAVPLFYLGGLSNNDFMPAFEKLFGELPAGFSSASITRMKQVWLEVLRDLKERGMPSPKLCIGDGALGFWKAILQVYPAVDHQRCWVHKTANVLDKMPKSVQTSAKALIHDIYRAETEDDARSAYVRFQERYRAKHPRAVENLMKDEAALFTFYNYPAKHWQHIRTTNTIESAFATVRLRTAKTRGQGTMATTLAMVFKLAERAQLKWRRLQGHHLVEEVIKGVKFVNGIEETLAA